MLLHTLSTSLKKIKRTIFGIGISSLYKEHITYRGLKHTNVHIDDVTIIQYIGCLIGDVLDQKLVYIEDVKCKKTYWGLPERAKSVFLSGRSIYRNYFWKPIYKKDTQDAVRHCKIVLLRNLRKRHDLRSIFVYVCSVVFWEIFLSLSGVVGRVV